MMVLKLLSLLLKEIWDKQLTIFKPHQLVSEKLEETLSLKFVMFLILINSEKLLKIAVLEETLTQ